MNNYLYPVVELRAFIILTVCASLGLSVFCVILMERRKKGIISFGLQGIFLGRGVADLVYLSLGCTQVIFVLAMILGAISADKVQLALLALLGIGRCIAGRNGGGTVSEISFAVLQGAALTALNLLHDYIRETGFDWYIGAVILLLSLFIFQYGLYHFVKGVERMLRRGENAPERDESGSKAKKFALIRKFGKKKGTS